MLCVCVFYVCVCARVLCVYYAMVDETLQYLPIVNVGIALRVLLGNDELGQKEVPELPRRDRLLFAALLRDVTAGQLAQDGDVHGEPRGQSRWCRDAP